MMTKEEKREYMQKYWADNKERLLDYSRKYSKKKRLVNKKYREDNKVRCKKWYQENKEEQNIKSREYNYKNRDRLNKKKLEYYKDEENKRKRNIRGLTNSLIRGGKLIRPSKCTECNSKGKTEAHHKDYSDIYDVVWLCRECHIELHKKMTINT